MKKKSRQNSRHKSSNFFNLVTKVFLVLLIITSTASTGFLSTLTQDLEFVDVAQESSAEMICTGQIYMGSCTNGDWYDTSAGPQRICTGQMYMGSCTNGDWITIGGGGSSEPAPAPTPTEITCPSGTTKVGSGSSAYCLQTQTQTKYPTSCPSGTTGKGTPGTSSFYCEKSCPPTVTTVSNAVIQIGNRTTATVGVGGDVTFSPDGFNGVGWGDDSPYIGIFTVPSSQTTNYWEPVMSTGNVRTYDLTGVNNSILYSNPLELTDKWSTGKQIFKITSNANSILNLSTGQKVALMYYTNNSMGEKNYYVEIMQVTNSTKQTNTTGGCAAGTTTKEYIKVTEKEYIGANDIDLENIMGEFGSSGERADGQFDLDSGNHNNGWYLNGNGDSYKSNHVQFTNIPDNGHVNAIGNSWQPEYLITQGKLKIEVPKSPKSTAVELQKRDTDLNNFKSTKSLSEVIAYKVTDLEKLKEIQNSNEGLSDLFAKTGSTYKYGSDITSHIVNSQGEGVYNDFKINESGYYIIASKYLDMDSATKEQSTPSQETLTKHTYYSFIPVSINFMTDLGYLPIQNNLLTQINDSILTVGNKKANHKLPNLAYESYKSLKAPSAYNHTSGKTVIGSTSGGIQLLSKDLSPIAVSTTLDVANIKVTDAVEHDKGFYISSDKGILYLNCVDNSLSETSVTDSVNDLEMNYDSLYYITDTRLSMLFVDGANLIESSKNYDLTIMFNDPSTKAGRVEFLNGLLTVSSKDDSSLSEVITLTK